jgi:hypothetical protein
MPRNVSMLLVTESTEVYLLSFASSSTADDRPKSYTLTTEQNEIIFKSYGMYAVSAGKCF